MLIIYSINLVKLKKATPRKMRYAVILVRREYVITQQEYALTVVFANTT
jgi:hypothetical protein